MRVLFAVWEIPPFFKVGGLGDVARALPADLVRMGVEVAVVAPLYKAVRFGDIPKVSAGKFNFNYFCVTCITITYFIIIWVIQFSTGITRHNRNHSS